MGPRWLAVLALVIAWPSFAPADPLPTAAERAKKLNEAGGVLGRSARTSGDVATFDKAIAKFKAAFALDPLTKYQCNLGIAYRDSKRLEQAHAYLSRCLARPAGIAKGRRRGLQIAQAKVEKQLRAAGSMPVDIRATPVGAVIAVSAFAADERFPAPVQLWLSAGSHTVTASAPGFTAATRTVKVTSGEKISPLTMNLVRVPVVAAPNIAPMEQRPGRSKAPWLLISGGSVAAVGGVVFHVLFLRNKNRLDGLDSQTRSDTESTMEKQRAAAVGLYVIGAAAIGYGTYRLLKRKKRGSSVALTPPSRGRGAMVVWTYTP